MSLISEFLGTEDWELNNSPMYRELIKELTAMNRIEKQRVFPRKKDNDDLNYMNGRGLNVPPMIIKDELIDIMLESYKEWKDTYKDELQHLQAEFRKAAKEGHSKYRVSPLSVENVWVKPEFAKTYFEPQGLSVDISNSDCIIFSWLN